MDPKTRLARTRRYKTGRRLGFIWALIIAINVIAIHPFSYWHGPWPWLLIAACLPAARMTAVLAALPEADRALWGNRGVPIIPEDLPKR